jgi:TP53 regulating kinase-like protein
LKAVEKIRAPKLYRVRELDTSIRRTRTIHEASIIHDAKRAGVSTPLVYMVDILRTSIVMQYIEGTRLREYLGISDSNDRIKACRVLGDRVGRLHVFGIVHGDLTTSNMILTPNQDITLIDFGLAEYSKELEKQGIDILLGQRVFQSTHHDYGLECYKAFFEGYRARVGKTTADQVEERVKQIAKRGRYAVER